MCVVQAHGTASQGARLPLESGADEQISEEEERAVLPPAHRLLQGEGRGGEGRG